MKQMNNMTIFSEDFYNELLNVEKINNQRISDLIDQRLLADENDNQVDDLNFWTLPNLPGTYDEFINSLLDLRKKEDNDYNFKSVKHMCNIFSIITYAYIFRKAPKTTFVYKIHIQDSQYFYIFCPASQYYKYDISEYIRSLIFQSNYIDNDNYMKIPETFLSNFKNLCREKEEKFLKNTLIFSKSEKKMSYI